MKRYFANGSNGSIVAKEILLVDGDNEVVGVITVVDGKVKIVDIEPEVAEEESSDATEGQKKAKKSKSPVVEAANNDGGTPPTPNG